MRGISQALGTLKCCCPSFCLSQKPSELSATFHFHKVLGKADRPLVQLEEMESAGVVFQHLIWRPSASQASRVPCACPWQWGLAVMLWLTAVLADVCVGTIAGPQLFPQSPSAILKKFFTTFVVRSRIWFSLDDSLTAFSFALETGSDYQDFSDISWWLINSLPGIYLMLSPKGFPWIQLCFIPHRPSVLFHPSLL